MVEGGHEEEVARVAIGARAMSASGKVYQTKSGKRTESHTGHCDVGDKTQQCHVVQGGFRLAALVQLGRLTSPRSGFIR